ncbi:gamma-glutamylcyclotransferase family protein [Paenibacillus xylanexedens]|uniref:gamma-glutamylcyclotransferase family protein n=1 Tax=Paenibacillus xylanexedens TaxID=528191 RepID=UPI000F546778|nr:gamma-glutamylcyclotransferase family protein [Paenibacillus xylanexedens]
MTMTMVPMFTYGILKYPENIVAEGGINIIENTMVKGHVMYAYNGKSFPITRVTNNPNDVIYGTYFEVYEQMVTAGYDVIEGYDPLKPPHLNMYNRDLVEVIFPNGEKKQANMYIANKLMFNDSLIPEYEIVTGNFDDRRTHMRLILESNM